LAVELTFYLIAPFVLRNRKLLTGLLALSLSLRVGFAVLASGFAFSDPWTYRFFPFELSLFLAGALSQQLLLPLWEKHPRKEMLARYSTIAFAIVSVAYFLIPVPEGIKTALLLGAFVVILPLTFIFQNGHRFDKTIGNLSYPIYVGHLLVIDGMSKVAVRLNVHSDLAISLVSVAASLVFAYGLNEMIAEPLEKYRRKVKGRQFGTEQTAEAAIGGGGGRSG
jgi:peptidoglycan/LPS O-acetylase OafA/YrhL